VGLLIMRYQKYGKLQKCDLDDAEFEFWPEVSHRTVIENDADIRSADSPKWVLFEFCLCIAAMLALALAANLLI